MKMVSLGNTGMRVGQIGLGCEHLQGKDEALVREVVGYALGRGINFFDVFMSEPNVRTYIGRALAGARKDAIIQGHIGAVWLDGQYAVRRELDLNKAAFEDLLTRLQTEYIDCGMIHFLDDPDEWDRFLDSDTLRYALELKRAGAVRALGLSCHNPVTALKAVESGLIEVLLFSLNPAYDLLGGETAIDQLFGPGVFAGYEDKRGVHPERARLYQACERRGVAITVMKALGAGALLDPRRTPFGRPMTVAQCLHYALTRPGVASVLLGMQSTAEIDEALTYYDLPEDERDYAAALAGTPRYSLKGHCMYCNHCLPCPRRIDIAAVNKYFDLAEGLPQVPETVAGHYLALERTASDCIGCGVCEKRCPFDVPVVEKMRRAATLFGK